MAINPTFLSKLKTKVSNTGSIVFEPTKPSRIYNAYCRNSSGAGNNKVEVGSPLPNSPNVVNANIDANIKYELYNFGIDKYQVPTGSSSAYAGKWFEQVRTLGTINFGNINIELDGNFPLTYETTFQYELNIPGNPREVRIKTFPATTTAQTVADAIILDLLSRRQVGFYDGQSYTSSELFAPSISYVVEIDGSSGVSEITANGFSNTGLQPTAPTSRPTDLSKFTKTSSGNVFTYTYNKLSLEGKQVPDYTLYQFTFLFGSGSADYPITQSPLPNSDSTIGSETIWAVTTKSAAYNGESGSESDPYKLQPDLRTKLLNYIQDGSIVSSKTGGRQSFTLTADNFTVSELIPSPPLLVDQSFTAAGESIELISDATVNPLILKDVHGNDFFPVSPGQRIVVSAPEAESVILVYGEE